MCLDHRIGKDCLILLAFRRALLLSDELDSIILSLIMMYICMSSFNTVRLQITTSKLFYTSEVQKRIVDVMRHFQTLLPYPRFHTVQHETK